VNVVVKDSVSNSAKILNNSDSFDRPSASEIKFTVTVPANGEKKVTYTVEDTYKAC